MNIIDHVLPALPKGSTWQATNGLRLRLHACGRSGQQLEQGWQCLETGEIEWRVVPVIKQCKCEDC